MVPSACPTASTCCAVAPSYSAMAVTAAAGCVGGLKVRSQAPLCRPKARTMPSAWPAKKDLVLRQATAVVAHTAAAGGAPPSRARCGVAGAPPAPQVSTVLNSASVATSYRVTVPAAVPASSTKPKASVSALTSAHVMAAVGGRFARRLRSPVMALNWSTAPEDTASTTGGRSALPPARQ